MKSLVGSVALVVALCGHLNAQAVTSTVADGGSVTTDLGYNIKVNKGSTLHRSWVVLNDAGSPVQLEGAGVNTALAGREYNYKAVGKAKSTVSIAALELRFLLYDVFGNHIKTLSGTHVTDIAAAGELPLIEIGNWRASENEVSELLTVVGFVAYVRSADGKVWRHDEKAIGTELTRIQLQVKSGVLEPTKQ